MKYHIYTESDIIQKSRTLIHAFMNRQMLSFKELLDENFVWIGDYKSQYIKGRETFMNTVSEEIMLPPLELTQEEYSILTHERHTWISYGRCTVTIHTGNNAFLSTGIHFTFVWKQDKDELLLCLASATHVQDDQNQSLPATDNPTVASDIPQARVFDQINPNVLSSINMPRICLKDDKKNLHFISPNEIIYAQSDNKYCTVYTLNSQIYSYMPLHKLELPVFFRIHKQFVVNPSYVTSLRRYEVTLMNSVILPIGKEHFKGFQEVLKSFSC